MNEALELIKTLETEEQRCKAVDELLTIKETKIKLLENIIAEQRLQLDSCRERMQVMELMIKESKW